MDCNKAGALPENRVGSRGEEEALYDLTNGRTDFDLFDDKK